MRIKVTLLMIAAGAAVSSCSKEPEPVVPPPTPHHTPAPAKPLAPGSTPLPGTAVAPGHPPVGNAVVKTRLAPEGVFYLLERASVMTDAGVLGYAPGTVVHMVKLEGTTARVAAEDKQEFQVASSSLTNDLDVAARVLKKDQKSQDAVRDMMTRNAAEAAKAATPPPPFDRRHP